VSEKRKTVGENAQKTVRIKNKPLGDVCEREVRLESKG